MPDEGSSSTALAAPRDAILADGDAGPLSDEALASAVQNRSPSFRPGVVIADKYVVERLIGEGGLGVVVAAKHVQLEQMVAIKYLRSKALVSTAVAERFVREARLAAKIRSDHVARVYDVGTLPSGAPYMVMEYLSGMDLGRMLGATGPLPIWRAVDYVLQACEALGAAHAAGIVHRDIKPENLFVTTGPTGTPLLKVLDFGISKLTSDRARVEPGQGGEVTVAGELFGTPAYMSPEQLLATDDVDGRTDVWAVGVVLYQLLSGRLPFDGESLAELCAAIVNKHPLPLTDVRAEVPSALARSVERCLAKARDERFQTVADLRAELAPFAVASREQRIGQVLRTLDAADQGRPPTPLPDELLTRALRAAPVPTFEDDRWVATTASGVASQTPPAIQAVYVDPPPAKRRKGRLVAVLSVAAASVVGVGLLVAAAAGTSADRASSETEATEQGVGPVAAARSPWGATSATTALSAAAAIGTPPLAPGQAEHAAPADHAAQAAAPPPDFPSPPSVPSPSRPSPASAAPPARHAQSGVAGASGASKAPAGASPQTARSPAPASAGASGHAHPVDPNAVLNPFD